MVPALAIAIIVAIAMIVPFLMWPLSVDLGHRAASTLSPARHLWSEGHHGVFIAAASASYVVTRPPDLGRWPARSVHSETITTPRRLRSSGSVWRAESDERRRMGDSRIRVVVADSRH